MKTSLLLILMLLLGLSVSGQKKMTDREFEGFKGEVKTILNSYLKIENSKDSKKENQRKVESHYFFDNDGRLAQVLYPETNYKVVFSVVDGFKTFKSSKIEKETREIPKFGAVRGEEKPIEGPDKIVPPDDRFDEKYVYEYDSKGRVKTEREYLNNGKLVTLSTFKYDKVGNLIEEVENNTGAITTFSYKYDENRNLIEIIEDRDIKGAGTDSKSKTVYNDYKVDEKGNWIERKRTYHFIVNEKPHVAEYTEYRTITYY